jgi:hypothetical protein
VECGTVTAGQVAKLRRLLVPVCNTWSFKRASLLKTVRPLFLLLPETEEEGALLFLEAANFVFADG